MHPSAPLFDPARADLPARAPRIIRCTYLAGWICLLLTLAFWCLLPPEDLPETGLRLALSGMGLLFQIGLCRGYAGARLGWTVLLCLTGLSLAASPWPAPSEGLLLAPNVINAGCAAGFGLALWLPGMHRWRGAVMARRRTLDANSQRRLARQGLWYGTAWLLEAILCLGCAEEFDMPVRTILLTFVPAIGFSGGLLASNLVALIRLGAPVQDANSLPRR